MACLIYLHAVMIVHNASERVRHLMQFKDYITQNLGVAVVAEVGRVIDSLPFRGLALELVSQFIYMEH